MPVKDVAREAAFAAVNDHRSQVEAVARDIYTHPEGPGNEHHAARVLAELLEQHGFAVESGIAGLSTSWRATKFRHDTEAMRKGLRHGHVGFIAEYDADPADGHIQGHHLGTGAVVAAALGLAAALEHEYGTVTVFGCSGPEQGGGMVAMAKEGLFNETDAVLAAVPAGTGQGYCHTISRTGATVAFRHATVRFSGESAERARESILVALDELRQSLGEYDDLGAKRDGDAAVAVDLQGETSPVLIEMCRRLVEMAHDSANETGAEVEVEFADATDDTIVSRILARRVKTYADTLGFAMDPIRETPPAGPSGYGSVSYAVPMFRLQFPVGAEDVARGEKAFAEVANTPYAYDQMARYAQCLCFTGLDVLREMEYRAIADDQLVKELARRGIERKHRRWLGVHPVIRSGENGKKRGPRLAGFKSVNPPGSSE